jgi:glycosyltransferase involved in cell wall biosynthesis
MRPAVEAPPTMGQASQVTDRGALISVCLLTYNHAHLIGETLKSILEQSLRECEVIVSDDCSTDGTWDEILKIAASDARVRPKRTPRNVGVAANANYAVSHSTRPYVALLHHDDLYREDLLDKWVAALERHPDAAFVFNPYGVDGSDVVHESPMPGECFSGHWLMETYLLPRWGCVVRGTAMIRRTAWDEVGGMRERFGLLADVDLWMRLATRWNVAYVAEPLIWLRQVRPEDYPSEYKETEWSWRRYRLLCEIHAVNRLDYLDLDSLQDRIKWWWFRARLSIQTAKWLAYAVVRRKPHMIQASSESATEFDLWPLRVLRWSLRSLYARQGTAPV